MQNNRIQTEVLRFFTKCVLILDIVAIIQYKALNVTVDQLTGGVPSAHILGFYNAIVFLYICSKIFFLKKGHPKKKRISIIDLFTLIILWPVLFLADAKYLMGNMILSFLFISFITVAKSIFKSIAVFTFILGIIISYNSIKESDLKLSTKSAIDISFVTNRLLDGAKIQLLNKTIQLPINEPLTFLIGSGPGTFLSRAANSRAYNTMNKSASLGEGESVSVDSKLPSFIPPKTTWITKKYAVEYFNIVWYGTLFDYRSSIISLFWEFGICGFGFFMFFLYKICSFNGLYSKSNPSQIYNTIFLKSFILFFILNAFLAYYFEYPKYQILFWFILGMGGNKKIINSINLSISKHK